MIDIAFLAIALFTAFTGWHRGIVVRGLQLVGLISFGALAYHFAPRFLSHIDALARPSVARSVVLVLVTWIAAMIGEAIGSRVGRRIMGKPHRAKRTLDGLAGAAASVLTLAFVAWFAATAAAPSLPATSARQISQSKVLAAVDSVMPETPRTWAARLATSLNTSRFPSVFNGLSPEPSTDVGTPNSAVTSSAAVQQASNSVVKVLSDSTSCGGAEGSGWVVASQRIVTNAHVVAGAQHVTVQVKGVGPRLSATVVGYDPSVDLAILKVPQLSAPALARDTSTLKTGTDAVVAGFPLNGNYKVVPARVGTEIDATGRNIYSTGLVTRTIYSLNTTVQPGNSGGPLLTPSGKVAGTVFGRSTTSTTTGYALTDAETSHLLDAASSLSSAVSTQSCVVE